MNKSEGEPIVARQPMQPLINDEHGVTRFKANSIVVHLLERGGISLNDLAVVSPDFPQEDWEQFAQLLGYSLSGFGDLDYVRDDTYDTASQMSRTGDSEQVARIKALDRKLMAVRDHLRSLVPVLFEVHPDDLSVNLRRDCQGDGQPQSVRANRSL